MSRVFDLAFIDLIGAEGGLSEIASDSGNWTGGRVGVGTLRGTKYGISAASFPHVDIVNLSIDQAKNIYYMLYWQKIHGDDLPPPLAHITFDAAVNSGVSRAAVWLQTAVGAKQDGVIGPATLAAVRSAVARNGMDAVRCAALAERALFMASLGTFHTFGKGWMRRLFGLPIRSDRLDPNQPVVRRT